MYFLEKLCRICVQNGRGLVDINTIDFDSVRLSDKLETCTSLVLSKDEVSTEICEKCVNKLRVSYHFLDMCKKSTKIIQGYLNKLTAQENKADFKNFDLRVDLEDLPPQFDETLDQNEIQPDNNTIIKRKQRITKEQRCSLLKQLLNRPKKDRDKSYFTQNDNSDYDKGGLKNIIDFTRNYEFNLDKNCNIESTPLDKLTAFSTNYFTRDFSDFKNHVLYVIENRQEFEYYSDDDCSYEDEQFEHVTVEPDIKIKSEIDSSEEDQCPLDYLETSFEVKQERLSPEPVSINSSVKLLDRLVSSYPIGARKVFSQNNVRCRTREQPYINPMLKNQFLYRSFRCERCNRYFKSQGYLKAHNSKVH
ncbi:unnamed protein product [Ceutorhynchus assimilis]|uniref:C2H2-type domain-containing protein n=1 Tax=Ceutorhynchus assimilis TaxID=467358 RepID=A0A9N9QIH8_9CUCU|nr:unnamed protein product [Ceutorhynchus assimilis]